MAWHFPVSTSGVGLAVPVMNSDGDSVFVAAGVLVASTGNAAIWGTTSNHQIIIAGTAVSNAWATIHLGDAPAIDHDNRVTVEAGGEIRSFGASAIELAGYQNQVTNAGFIYGKDAAILIVGNAATTSTVVNSGTIVSDRDRDFKRRILGRNHRVHEQGRPLGPSRLFGLEPPHWA